MGGEGKRRETPVRESRKRAGPCSVHSVPSAIPAAPPGTLRPRSAQPHGEAHASSAACPAFYTAADSGAGLPGLAVELEEAAVVGNAAERRKRVV